MPRVKLFDRSEVLQKAKDLFWKKGYHATSMQELVKYLGISRSSLYDTFGGKKTLFDESLALYCSSNKQDMQQFLDSQTDAKEAFKTLFKVAIAESMQNNDCKGCFVVNSTTELAENDMDTKSELIKNQVDFEKMFQDFLMKAQQQGKLSLDKDAAVLSNLIYTLYSGVIVVAKIEPAEDKLLKSVDMALSLLD